MTRSGGARNESARARSTPAPTGPSDAAACASLLKVLADETRLAVMRELMAGPRHVGALNEAIRIDQSLLSHHLKVLREAGLVLAERDGKAVLYRIAPGVEPKPSARSIDLGCCQLSFPKPRRT